MDSNDFLLIYRNAFLFKNQLNEYVLLITLNFQIICPLINKMDYLFIPLKTYYTCLNSIL